MRTYLLAAVLTLLGQMAEGSYLYRMMMVRAAPGKIFDLLALYENRMPVYDASGDERPLWMRHTQGDQWDLLLIFPMGSFSEYYAPERMARREKAAQGSGLPQPEFMRLFYGCAGWHEDIYVDGPALEELKKAYSGAGFFHTEMFVALPGKQAELRKERDMENTFSRALGRPEAFSFTHNQGAAWDLISLAFYRDLEHFAEARKVPADKQDTAAKAAGFESAEHIGAYLRTLIATHHDTLGVTLK